jgi:diguanylate cyclase (GGDEF)-like protein/PAS domain S-box-containing protein
MEQVMRDEKKTKSQLRIELEELRRQISKLKKSEALRRHAEDALRESEERYRRMVAAVTSYTYSVKVDNGRVISTRHSVGCKPVTGYSPEDYDLKPDLWYSTIFPDDRAMIASSLRNLLHGNEVAPSEHRIIRGDGVVIWIRNTLVPHYDASGHIVRFDGLVEDITNRKITEDALRASEIFLQTIIETEPECVKLLASDGTLLKMNKAGLAMIEADSLEEVRGKCLYPLVASEHRRAFEKLTEEVFEGKAGKLEFEIFGIRGRHLWVETHAVPLRDEKQEIIALLGITRDITEKKQIEEQLRILSVTDELTGLYNRRGFFTLAEQQLKVARRLGKAVFLLSGDLDNLKELNDELGHQKGDQMLTEAAAVLRESFRESDIIARIGGDEFVVFQMEDAAAFPERIVRRLQKNIDAHNAKKGRDYVMSLSYGVVQCTAERACSVDAMLLQADKKMYEQKRLKHDLNLSL